MVEKSDLKRRESFIWSSFFKDGFWDISLGLMLVTIGIRAITENIWVTMLFLISMLVITLGKSMITMPRLIDNEMAIPERRKVSRKFKFFGILILLLIVILELILAGKFLSFFKFRAYIQGMGLVVFFGLIANLFNFKRLYLYGIIFAIALVMWEVLGVPVGPYLAIIFGGLILITGLILLMIFLKEYNAEN